MTTRMLPPIAQTLQTVTVNGTVYSCAPGSALDVADADVAGLPAGWITIAQSGATGARPTNQLAGTSYFDTTLGKLIMYDGSAWRNITTGGAA